MSALGHKRTSYKAAPARPKETRRPTTTMPKSPEVTSTAAIARAACDPSGRPQKRSEGRVSNPRLPVTARRSLLRLVVTGVPAERISRRSRGASAHHWRLELPQVTSMYLLESPPLQRLSKHWSSGLVFAWIPNPGCPPSKMLSRVLIGVEYVNGVAVLNLLDCCPYGTCLWSA